MDFDSLYLCVKDILRYSYICESVLNLKVKKMDRAYLLEKSEIVIRTRSLPHFK